MTSIGLLTAAILLSTQFFLKVIHNHKFKFRSVDSVIQYILKKIRTLTVLNWLYRLNLRSDRIKKAAINSGLCSGVDKKYTI